MTTNVNNNNFNGNVNDWGTSPVAAELAVRFLSGESYTIVYDSEECVATSPEGDEILDHQLVVRISNRIEGARLCRWRHAYKAPEVGAWERLSADEADSAFGLAEAGWELSRPTDGMGTYRDVLYVPDSVAARMGHVT